MRRWASFGLVALIVVMAIVLYLSAHQAKQLAQTAGAVTRPVPASASDQDGSSQIPTEGSRQDRLPRLQEMKQETAEHTGQVQKALEQAQ